MHIFQVQANTSVAHPIPHHQRRISIDNFPYFDKVSICLHLLSINVAAFSSVSYCISKKFVGLVILLRVFDLQHMPATNTTTHRKKYKPFFIIPLHNTFCNNQFLYHPNSYHALNLPSYCSS